MGVALPEPRAHAIGVVADGKLFVLGAPSEDLLVYDPHSRTWTEEAPPPTVTITAPLTSACARNGRLVVFLLYGTAFERANDGSWSPYEVAEVPPAGVSESVILG